MKFLIAIFLALMFLGQLVAQPPPNISQTTSPPGQTAVDTTTSRKGGGFLTVFHGNPGKAALYSLILPGAGQLYNGRWWKLPFVYALEGTAVYFYIQNRNKFNQFNFCYESLVLDGSLPPPECESLSTVSDAYRVRNSYRSNKEISLLLIIGAHVLQSLEAFIDRHLIDFDIDEDLTGRRPNQHLEYQGIELFRISIPITGKKQKEEYIAY